MLAPIEEKIAARLAEAGREGSSAALARQVMAVETGALLGILANVLGQYELVLPDDDDQGDVVALVEANVLMLERQQQFRPSEFRMWIALHEATHRSQFIGVPWLRQYFLDLVHELVANAGPATGRLSRLVAEAVSAGRSGQPILDDTGIIGLLATPEQKKAIDKVQALMSLLEGHGHVVMDRIGARILPSQQRMSSILKARRKDPRTAALFRLLGMEMKMKQYELGEASSDRRGGGRMGSSGSRRESPRTLPTLDEIYHPQEWLPARRLEQLRTELEARVDLPHHPSSSPFRVAPIRRRSLASLHRVGCCTFITDSLTRTACNKLPRPSPPCSPFLSLLNGPRSRRGRKGRRRPLATTCS